MTRQDILAKFRLAEAAGAITDEQIEEALAERGYDPYHMNTIMPVKDLEEALNDLMEQL